jgi:hypothetical protein
MSRWAPVIALAFAVGVGTGIAIDRVIDDSVARPTSLVPTPLNFSPGRTAVVPTIEQGISIDAAKEIVTVARLTPVVRSVHPLGRPPFTFLHQIPAGGSIVLEGTAVTLFAT